MKKKIHFLLFNEKLMCHKIMKNYIKTKTLFYVKVLIGHPLKYFKCVNN